MTPDKVHPRNKIVTMTSSPMQKYPIYPREEIKLRYDKSKNSNYDILHDENYTEHYKDKE